MLKRTERKADICQLVFFWMNPTGGVGGVVAIHDAVTLANQLSTLHMAKEEHIEKVFKEYRTERYPVVKAAFESSQMFTKSLRKVLSDDPCS